MSSFELPRRSLRLGLLAATLAISTPAHADPPPGYYASIDASSASTLRATLHAVIDDHTRFPYTASSTDTWDILEAAQEDPANPGHILDLYRNASYPKAGGGNPLYNREHAWPKSHGFPDDSATNYPYTDCHLLYLADTAYNGARGNNPYGACNAACSALVTSAHGGLGGESGPYPNDDNWVTGAGGIGGVLGRFETWSGRRGDVARALFYADVRYEGGAHGVTGAAEPNLVLTDDESLIVATTTGKNVALAYMGMLSTLLTWHAQDPVDAFERRRNDVVARYQGNRNPFVDHPEWVSRIFTVSSRAAPRASVWINELHYDNTGSDSGEFVEIAGSAGTSLAGWSLVGYNGAGGALYRTVPLSGIIPNQQGCAGTLAFNFPGLQNGGPDGIALIDPSNHWVELLSYEGAFVASTGPAAGATSVDIGVSETSDTPVDQSLGLIGSGSTRASFRWRPPAAASPGAPNPGQTLSACAAAASLSWTSANRGLLVVLALALLGTGFGLRAAFSAALAGARERRRSGR